MTTIYSVESADYNCYFETKKDAIDYANKIFKQEKENGDIYVSVIKCTVSDMPKKSAYVAMLNGDGWTSEQQTIFEIGV